MTSTIRNPQAGFIDLTHDQILVLDDRRGSRVQVLFGGVWMTEEKSEQDRFIEAGSGLQIERPGRVVIEALGRARLRICGPAASIAARWRARLSGLLARRAGWLAQGGAVVLALVISVGLTELTARGFHAQDGAMHASSASQPASAVRPA